MIKVEHTKTHEIPLQLLPTMHGLVATRPKTTALVTEAKLVLVDTGTDGDYPGYSKQIIGVNHRWVRPILISETEKIEVGELFYHPDRYNKIGIAEEDLVYPYCKVLALPKHLSPEQLSQIVSGELKDGQKVLLEVEKV